MKRGKVGVDCPTNIRVKKGKQTPHAAGEWQVQDGRKKGVIMTGCVNVMGLNSKKKKNKNKNKRPSWDKSLQNYPGWAK